MPSPVFALVELSDRPMLLLIAGLVFLFVFAVVAAVAYMVLPGARGAHRPSTWTWRFERELPVSKAGFDSISALTAAAISIPEVSPAQRERLDRFGRTRDRLVTVYRVLMTVIGLGGLAAATLLFRSHTPANMQGLPGAIVLLLSLGALLEALIPSKRIRPDPIEPLDADFLEQMKKKIDVKVVSSEPLTIALSEAEMRQAADVVARSGSISDAARAVHPAYDSLSETDKRGIDSVLARALRER